MTVSPKMTLLILNAITRMNIYLTMTAQRMYLVGIQKDTYIGNERNAEMIMDVN